MDLILQQNHEMVQWFQQHNPSLAHNSVQQPPPHGKGEAESGDRESGIGDKVAKGHPSSHQQGLKAEHAEHADQLEARSRVDTQLDYKPNSTQLLKL
jgi:hypothetical protein